MLGYPPKVLLKAVEAEGGPETLARVKRLAGLADDSSYRMNRDYGPEEIERLAASVGEVMGLTREQVEDLWVRTFFTDIVARWPMWFKTSKTARQLLELQPEIHNSFAKATADPGARRSVGEKFRLDRFEQETVVHYRSPHRLCRLYVQMARRVLDYYGETARIDEPHCQRRGDPECEIHIRWI